METKTPCEWMAALYPHMMIIDPDGWRGINGRPFDDPISEQEFRRRFARCTISGKGGGFADMCEEEER
jgi:hypothetical protein